MFCILKAWINPKGLSKIFNCLLESTYDSNVMRIKTLEPPNRPIPVGSGLRGMGKEGGGLEGGHGGPLSTATPQKKLTNSASPQEKSTKHRHRNNYF